MRVSSQLSVYLCFIECKKNTEDYWETWQPNHLEDCVFPFGLKLDGMSDSESLGICAFCLVCVLNHPNEKI